MNILRISISETRVDKELLSREEDEEIMPYFEDYDDRRMWMSYWHQINEVFKTGGEKVLVVGVGNKTVPNYLRTVSEYSPHKNLEVTTADIDENLDPDRVCDVTELSESFENDEYDTILCAEVLEHLPFEKVKTSLDELYKVTKDWVIISLPYAGQNVRFSLELPDGVRTDFTLKMTENKEHEDDGWHKWEVGKKGYSKEKITKLIGKKFEITRSFIPPENLYHLFYVLKKKK